MLIKSHYENDNDRFNTIVLQLAAYEANKGHQAFARQIRDILEKGRNLNKKIVPINKELNEMILLSNSEYYLKDLVLHDEIKSRIERILLEYRQKEKLNKFGLNNRRKILFTGPPGTGKTMTAEVIAAETGLPFCTIMVDRLVTKFMGETSVKLRQIFENISEVKAVYLFDEFDAIGSERSLDNDVGEMRRVLNSFLQFLENENSGSFIIAATNNLKLLDQALFRRFDDVIQYQLPDKKQIIKLIQIRLGQFSSKDLYLNEIAENSLHLSHAEISKACDDAIKEAILNDTNEVNEKLLGKMFNERISVYRRGD
nr:ATP-binding protein [Paenibacillus lupini]